MGGGWRGGSGAQRVEVRETEQKVEKLIKGQEERMVGSNAEKICNERMKEQSGREGREREEKKQEEKVR